MLTPYYSHFFFFLMTPRPPTSTLFPYTTLFRSSPGSQSAPRVTRMLVLFTPKALQRKVRGRRAHPGRRGCSPSLRRDRKSTRLNSSHSQISYAVFCLKKKKKIKYNSTTTNIHKC